jgi:hypothetical protein
MRPCVGLATESSGLRPEMMVPSDPLGTLHSNVAARTTKLCHVVWPMGRSLPRGVSVRKYRGLMLQIRHVFLGMLALAPPLSTPANSAVECKAELPAVHTGHWAWRIIDGKRCWYEGQAGLDKANLNWSRSAPGRAPLGSASGRSWSESYSSNVDELPFAQRWAPVSGRIN